MKALVLNASYEPLSVVPVRRAVVLVLHNRADVVESNGKVWHSERFELASPSVIRLRQFVRVPYARRVPLNRRAVFLRDSHECQYCNRSAENIDHVVPKTQGGTHTWENVVASCRRCNTKKGGRTPHQAGLILRRKPTVPRRHSWVLVAIGTEPDPAWEQYLG
ncbi:MAG: HNH endonuclease [bacterium]|nr:HNH endonuclease [bacterium]MCP4968643.1 HNH endonuclease [bacterium]